jgi:hypothetical protein
MIETKSKAEEKRDAQEAMNDVIAVMNTPAGRRYIWRLLEKAGVFRTPYRGSTNDTMVRIGNHSVGVEIMTEVIEANAELYLLMQKEHYILEVPDTDEIEKE